MNETDAKRKKRRRGNGVRPQIFEIWDGWNLILGAKKEANEDRLRLSYTGGTGLHRADRLIIDFVRMASYLGLSDRISVRTNDKDFSRAVLRHQ